MYHLVRTLLCFHFPAPWRIKWICFQKQGCKQGTRADTFRCLSFSLPSSLINNPSSLCLSLPRSHILPSCQLLSRWFSSSVWHIHRVCEHSSELFNPRIAPNWKTARERHGGSRLSATIIPPPPSDPPSPTSTSDREQALLMRRNSLIVWLYRSSW